MTGPNIGAEPHFLTVSIMIWSEESRQVTPLNYRGITVLVAQTGRPTGGRSDVGRAPLFFATRPLAFSDVEVLDWEPVLPEKAADPAKE